MQLVVVWGLEQRVAVRPDVTVSLIVGEDEEEVGLVRSPNGRYRCLACDPALGRLCARRARPKQGQASQHKQIEYKTPVQCSVGLVSITLRADTVKTIRSKRLAFGERWCRCEDPERASEEVEFFMEEGVTTGAQRCQLVGEG
jgi:hypothetical protein